MRCMIGFIAGYLICRIASDYLEGLFKTDE